MNGDVIKPTSAGGYRVNSPLSAARSKPGRMNFGLLDSGFLDCWMIKTRGNNRINGFKWLGKGWWTNFNPPG
jgi:hypothetical protein